MCIVQEPICYAWILFLLPCVVLCQRGELAQPEFSDSLFELYDVACKASLTQALLQVDPCKHSLASSDQLSEIYNATNLGLQNCGREARIRVGCREIMVAI